MKRKTFMSEELEAAGINVQYDAHAKRVLGSRQVWPGYYRERQRSTEGIPRRRLEHG